MGFVHFFDGCRLIAGVHAVIGNVGIAAVAVIRDQVDSVWRPHHCHHPCANALVNPTMAIMTLARTPTAEAVSATLKAA